ncbi:MAG: SUMF1/EgtB/PvdO family nonheme iron enzyme [Myxococcales bacterium]|nr:SUMF1/EgtB/PvdO family nonheme iron enzyme [Myxococcales bacterium]
MTQISLGESTSCALLADRTVYCWGNNEYGTVGDGSKVHRTRPVRIWPVQEAEPVDESREQVFESLACGVRLRMHGRRVWKEPSYITAEIDRLHIVSGAKTVTLRCFAQDGLSEYVRGQYDFAWPALATRPAKIGQHSCVAPNDVGEGFRRVCDWAGNQLEVRITGIGAESAETLAGQIEFFDPSSYYHPARTSSAAAPLGMIAIPAGEFVMGCVSDGSRGGEHCSPDEMPAHRVELSEFAIDENEVSWKLYEPCIRAGACSPPADDVTVYRLGKNTTLPVTHLTWKQARAFCAWSKKRLPTEAEWENAARGTDGRLYPWGNEAPTPPRANLGVHAKAVGGRDAGRSPYGVRDMAGNAREWVADYYDIQYYANSPSKDPLGPKTGVHRVVRDRSIEPKSSSRWELAEGETRREIGFRCAKSL